MTKAICSNDNIVQNNQRINDWTLTKIIYTGLMAFNLLGFFWLLITGSDIDMPMVFWITRIATAPLAIYLGKLWRDKGFQILTIYSLLFFFRVYIPNSGNIMQNEMAQSIFSALWLFAGCYGLGRILDNNQLKRFILVCSSIWTIGIAALCCLGIYVAWTGQAVSLLDKAIIQVDAYRLEIVYLATISGLLMSITILINMVLVFGVKNYYAKVVIFLVQLPIIIAMGLTDSRTAYISFSAAIGIMSFSYVFRHYKVKETEAISKPNKLKRWFYSIIILIIISAILILLITAIAPAFNHIKQQGIIPTAFAEKDEIDTHIASRGINSVDIFTGRKELWKRIWKCFDNRALLLYGRSKIAPLGDIIIYETHYARFAHSHSIYLQILLESGIPGIVLVMCFIFLLFYRSFRINAALCSPVWLCLLSALPISILLADTVECFTWLRSSQCPINAVFFITAGIICNEKYAK